MTITHKATLHCGKCGHATHIIIGLCSAICCTACGTAIFLGEHDGICACGNPLPYQTPHETAYGFCHAACKLKYDACPTTADKIVALFGDDGQQWTTTIDGIETDLDTVCAAHGSHTTYRDGYGTDTYRHIFPDGSAIVVSGAAYDRGLPGDCYCWEGAGHTCA